ncbi:acyltransferase family protein [Bacteroides congonensis]|uniref:acyltransferase family protein n=1 Tax=Bacteroides congonensis TaxID=1871006 RepID=UPI002675A125|nr:acyltransferase [Bacteroides congonensis]
MIKLLSKYRAELMGISMLMIMLFHTVGGLSVPSIPFFRPFWSFDFGVEFFLILSALGCTYSLDKNNDVIDFYKRRLKRIIPTFMIIVTLKFLIFDVLIYKTMNWQGYLWDLSLLSFFDGNITYWFILHILTCYLLTPYVYKKADSMILWVFIAIITFTIFIYGFNNLHVQNVSLYRYPIYFVSLIYILSAKKSVDGNENMNRVHLFLLTVFVVLVYILVNLYIHNPYKYLAYLGVSIPCLVFVAVLVDRIKNNFFRRIFKYIGTISLEMYLLHGSCLFLADMIAPNNVIFRWAFSFVLAITLATLLHKSIVFFNCNSKK